MKKFLSTAAILTLSAVVLTIPVFANEAIRQEEPAKLISVQQEIELNVLEGRIKEVRDFELVVEDIEGKEYIVPLFGFQSLEEYQTLNVQAGEEITIKGRDLSKGNAIKFVRSDIVGQPLTIKVGEEGFGMAPSLEIRRIAGVEVLSIDKEMVEGVRVMAREAAPIGHKEILDESKVMENRNIKVFKMDDVKTGEIEVQLIKAIRIGEEEEEGMVVKAMPASGDVFLPHEITINGITIELSMMTMAKPAIKAIK